MTFRLVPLRNESNATSIPKLRSVPFPSESKMQNKNGEEEPKQAKGAKKNMSEILELT
jgi:hypothetical protein